MEQINCHSSTPKQDLIDFVNKHKGKVIRLHFEYNGSMKWGDDDELDYNTNVDSELIDLLNRINNNYIHNIYDF